MRILFSLFLVLVFLGGCKKESDLEAPRTLQAQILGRTWLESREEETAGSDVKVFRPEGYAFPVSWARDGFRFDAGNVFTACGPSPIDGVDTDPGRWLTIGPNKFRITPNTHAAPYTLELVSLENDVLRVKVK
ncbi:hypothetical protein SAMN02745146_1206 [Hymenobacter daecheongensis DSM 21074]|uniref:Uncharacterized protein n=1 Tax=Hymenobacter daecheongensis DSM 21074 TaxID=1121955 RepID=A0A1M6CMJ6_9BACT|nr:hypothetical protein [Hymenobacter daecheongensis]SHI62226.1 hypothetical protein SAMN02745146_1206 [Hymenobacter daecheongensis DSM 21074]